MLMQKKEEVIEKNARLKRKALSMKELEDIVKKKTDDEKTKKKSVSAQITNSSLKNVFKTT
ncbi:hypothetical protein MHBO_004470 [Bonamia ostreae]|uniref:Uncharacterized protein n=1 Tax=Bonamia ostreae TaxID=126728 RepID=A0ABV2ATF0_9EUKA